MGETDNTATQLLSKEQEDDPPKADATKADSSTTAGIKNVFVSEFGLKNNSRLFM